MKVLLVGTGGVGESIAAIAKDKTLGRKGCLDVITTSNAPRKCKANWEIPSRFPTEWIDAGKQDLIEALAKKYQGRPDHECL